MGESQSSFVPSSNKVNYYGYGTLKFGVNVASGQLDTDAFAEILTGPGPGAVFGPHVRGWNYDAAILTPMSKISFFAHGTLSYGVNVATGDLDRDSYDEILAGAGPGIVFAPTVRGFVFDGSAVAAIAKVNFNAFTPLQYGVVVAGGDVDADGYGEIVCGNGPGSALLSEARGFDFDGTAVGLIPSFDVTPIATQYGARVGTGQVDMTVQDGRSDLILGAGPDPTADPTVRAYRYGGALSQIGGTFVPFAGRYGVNATGASLGW